MQIRKKTENTSLHLTLKYLGVFLLVFKTILEAEVRNTMDPSDRHQSLVQGDTPLGVIISSGESDSIAHFKDLYFHRGDIASTVQLGTSTTRFLSRNVDLNPKINLFEIKTHALFFSS